MNSLANKLFSRFEDLVKRRIQNISILRIYEALIKKYSEKQRYYHNLNHIYSCLKEFDEVKDLLKNPDSVELAIWYHDVIYNPSSKDNEKKSFKYFLNDFKILNLDSHFIENVKELILATKDHNLSKNEDINYLIDIDMSVLGLDWENFNSNTKKIRQEYSMYSDNEFIRGRIDFLKKMISRDSIYLTNYFKNKYEQKARKNLKKSILKLNNSF